MSAAEVQRVVRKVARSGADSVAVCLLFSFLNPAHEKLLARALAGSNLAVSASHEVLPEYREFERTSTTVVNAYLVPVMSGYLSQIESIARQHDRQVRKDRQSNRRQKKAPNVRIMQSNGGVLSVPAAAREPVRTILSGPAGGVLGAQYVAEASGFRPPDYVRYGRHVDGRCAAGRRKRRFAGYDVRKSCFGNAGGRAHARHSYRRGRRRLSRAVRSRRRVARRPGKRRSRSWADLLWAWNESHCHGCQSDSRAICRNRACWAARSNSIWRAPGIS